MFRALGDEPLAKHAAKNALRFHPCLTDGP